ncbi:hypothetical protein DICVIV_14059, partial [Dictyocaulus viviparus]
HIAKEEARFKTNKEKAEIMYKLFTWRSCKTTEGDVYYYTKGQTAFGKTKIHIAVPSIMEEKLFDAVQEQLIENRKKARQDLEKVKKQKKKNERSVSSTTGVS